MPSQPLEQDWNFSPVFDLIASDRHDIGSPTLQHEKRPVTLPEGGVGLGNFWKLYESLGLSTDVAVPPLPPLDESEVSSNPDDAVLASPINIEAIRDPMKDVAVRPLEREESFEVARVSASAAPVTTQPQQRPLAPPPTEVVEAPRTELIATSAQKENTTSSSQPSSNEEQRHLLLPTTEATNALRAKAGNGTVQKDIPVSTPGMTKKQRRKARRQAEQVLQEQAGKDQKAKMSASDNSQPEPIPDTPTKTSRAQSNVVAKIRSASPVIPVDEASVPQTPSPTPRPVLTAQRQSSVAPATPQSQPSSQGSHQPISRALQYSLAPQTFSQLQPPPLSTPGLIPRTVRPVTQPRQSLYAGIRPPQPNPVNPVNPSPARFSSPRQPAIAIRQQVDRHFHLFNKLMGNFPDERKWLVAPRQLVNENTRAEGIHIFVDASNIMIGFKDILRNFGVQPFDMSFDSLALLMERRRPAAKRALVGSHREANPLPATQRLIGLAKDVGYQCDVQEQVFISREDSKKKKFFNDVSKFGWQRAIQKRSGSGSDSETGAAAAPTTPAAPKWVEQGVDELLHLKMCQSILDTDQPSTMVLATGDGAEAEMSDGFLAHVERALRKGWKVELITWRQQMSGGYKRRAFRQRWGEQFTVIELDDYLEDLIDTP